MEKSFPGIENNQKEAAQAGSSFGLLSILYFIFSSTSEYLIFLGAELYKVGQRV